MSADRTIRRAIIAFGIFLLLLPLAIRALHHAPLLPGGAGYGHARVADLIAHQGIPAQDPAMPERPYLFSIFDLLLAAVSRIVGITGAALLVPFLLGLGTLACMALVARRWHLPAAVATGAQAVFVISPLFADVFTQATPRALELFLTILYLFVLSPSNPRPSVGGKIAHALFAAAIAAALATFGVVPAIAAFALPLLLRSVNRRIPKYLSFASLAAFLVLVAFALPAFLQQESAPFAAQAPVVLAISAFGGGNGLSLFAWMLALIGMIIFWRFKKRYYAMMFALTLLFLVALAVPSALILAHVAVSLLAGAALAFFAQMKWSFDDIRVLTLLVLLCGLLFSTLAHAMDIAQGPPTVAFRDAALAAKSALPANTTMLAYPDDGFWLEYWSGERMLLDGWIARTPRVDQRWAAAQAVWHAQDISHARQALYANNIGAVVITEAMRDGQVWDLPEQDLLFLLRNNETFKRTYHSSIVDIWSVLPEHS